MQANPSGKIRFAEVIRHQIAEEFKKQVAKQGTYVSYYGIDEDAEIFVASLESFADGIPEYKEAEPPKHQARREQLNSIARHLGELAQRIGDLDSAALGYLLYCATKEEGKRTGAPVEDGHPWDYMETAMEKRAEIMPTLLDLSLGAQTAAKTLPLYTFDYYIQTALCLERHFYNYQIKFSVTETGFSALCLRTIFEAAHLDTGSIKYWLRLARDHEDSMSTLKATLVNRLNGDDDE